jgi:hypothetical protein
MLAERRGDHDWLVVIGAPAESDEDGAADESSSLDVVAEPLEAAAELDVDEASVVGVV